MSETQQLDNVVQKIQEALAPHPIETQILALGTLMKVEADPEILVRLEAGASKKSTPLDIERAKEAIEKTMAGLGPESRHRVAQKIHKQYRDEITRLNAEKRTLDEQIRREEQIADALKMLESWNVGSGRPALERNDCSRLHKLKFAVGAGHLIDGGKPDQSPENAEALLNLEHTFVVKHDWAAAFEDAEGIADDAWRLPYDICVFEFRVTRRTIVLAAAQASETQSFTSFIEIGDFWLAPSTVNKLTAWLWGQVRAICIALDAEVATETVIRAPAMLNKKRAKAGKVPLQDYRIVDLARRHRIANPVRSTGSGTKKRLHFRRGHWRHYETSKTWVKWCLVGNPDLGFIQKSYSL